MKLLKTLLASAVAVSAMPALAYEAGDIIVKAGVVNVNPKSDSGIDGVTVDSDTQLGLTLTYMAAPQIGVEVLAATPFTHDVKAGGNKLGEVSHLPPTVSAQYYLMDPASAVQPYVGVGINHTFFFDEKLGGADAHLSSSWGLALSAGLNYNINDQYLANVAVWKMDIDSKINDTTDINIDPVVIMVGAGYKF